MIAGKNRSNAILAMLKNWDQVEAATMAANNSAGTAQKENEIFMDSLQGKLNALKASWQVFSTVFMSSDFLKGAVDSGTTLLNVLTGIVDTLTIPGTLAVGGGLFAFFKNLD